MRQYKLAKDWMGFKKGQKLHSITFNNDDDDAGRNYFLEDKDIGTYFTEQ